MITEKAMKIIKWVAYGIEAAFLVTFVILCVAVAKKNTTIKSYQYILGTTAEKIDSLQNRCDRLEDMEGISVSTTFVITNKNVLSWNMNNANVANRAYAEFTKGEVLNALDSLQQAREINNAK